LTISDKAVYFTLQGGDEAEEIYNGSAIKKEG
jgi:hypothetical protein